MSTTAQFFSPTTGTPTPQTLALNFDTDVSSSLTASMVAMKDLTNGDTVNVSSPTFSNGGMTALFTFSTYVDTESNTHPVVGGNGVSGWLPNGYYRLKLSASDLPALGQDFTSTFFFFAGDANNDGQVNGDDYFAIDQGFTGHLSGYVNGDFNLDGRIDADDYFTIDVAYSETPPLIADFAGDVPEEVMTDVYVDTTYTIPAVTTDGKLQQIQIAPPEDDGSPFVRGVDYDGQLNPDGSVSLTFNRSGPYIVQSIRTNGSSATSDLSAFAAGTGFGLFGSKFRSQFRKINPPSEKLVLVSSASGSSDDGFLSNARHLVSNYVSFGSVDDAITAIQNEYISNGLRPFSVGIVDHGTEGYTSMGGGTVNEPPGKYFEFNDPGSASDLQNFMSAVRGEVTNIDFFGCEVGGGAEGPLLLQQIASGLGATATGWIESTATSWFPIFGGSFWVMKGATLDIKFP